MATKGIRDGVTRAEEGAAPAGACENPWGHNVSALLSLTVESDKRRRALVRHQCGDAVGPCLIWVSHGPWVQLFQCGPVSIIVSKSFHIPGCTVVGITAYRTVQYCSYR